ncbi:hypothetical protein SNOG_02158 [Parastagonospora nodorum SN15]|nr:hypothetical protein SNOG_02158 [Parastagonospora nodorum SN15]EAT90370.1 hypothetical protein SNOG_02158 [Parastagonospora nodorum SN15]
MSAVLGPHHPQASEYEDLLPDLEAKLFGNSIEAPSTTSSFQHGLGEQLAPTRFETIMGETYGYTGYVFVTDKGYVGLRHWRWYTHADLNEQPLILAGLFGISLPFLLAPVGEGRYKMEGIVHVADHELGDENIEALGADGDWRDLVKEGKLEMFTIV